MTERNEDRSTVAPRADDPAESVAVGCLSEAAIGLVALIAIVTVLPQLAFYGLFGVAAFLRTAYVILVTNAALFWPLIGLVAVAALAWRTRSFAAGLLRRMSLAAAVGIMPQLLFLTYLNWDVRDRDPKRDLADAEGWAAFLAGTKEIVESFLGFDWLTELLGPDFAGAEWVTAGVGWLALLLTTLIWLGRPSGWAGQRCLSVFC